MRLHLDLREYKERSVEVPVFVYNGKLWCRISCHVYNDWDEYEMLGKAMLDLIG